MKTAVVFIFLAGTILAQGPPPQADMIIDVAVRNAVIDGALKALNEDYVYPDVATKMEQAIRDRQQRKEYDSITSAQHFALALTNDLREVSHDKHLRLDYVSQTLPMQPSQKPLQPPSSDAVQKLLTFTNFGFEKVERLAGNIGYLDLRVFAPSEFVGDTAAAAMIFLANSESLIIDLRKNGGGDPATVTLLASYLFGPQPVHLNDLYVRPSNETHQYWTLPYLPGKRLTGKDVYVLTSRDTFSGAEEFAYDLKAQKRATIIGETTGGGAHPVGARRLSDHFVAAVPLGRAINPITKTDWEGTGVEADIKVPAQRALATAYRMALEKELPKLTVEPRLKAAVEEAIRETNKELDGYEPGTK